MCGIAGYLLDDLPDNLDLLYEKLEHRGEDDGGIYKTKLKDGFLGLYHRRLSIYDLSKNASQPMRAINGKKIFIFNGAIYNFQELWESYNIDSSIKPKGDTEVLASAICELGTINTWKKCNGMFSIAIYEAENETLKLVRDRAGQKPLFYVLDPIINERRYKGIIFSSEIKSILSIIDSSINKKFIYEYLVLGRLESSTETLFNEIKRLDPSYEMQYNLSTKTPKFNSFWNLSESIENILNTEKTLDIEQKCKHHIKKAVEMQVTGERKLGIMLSSGIDSTVLASLMRSSTNKDIFSFTYDFKNSKEGESNISKKTSDLLKLNYVDSEKIDSNYIKNNLINVVKQQDEPITSIRTVAQHYIHKIASDIDCRIIIEGNGGDEIFGGYEYYSYARTLDNIQNPTICTSDILNNLTDHDLKNFIVGIRSVMLQGVCSKDGTESRNLESLKSWAKKHYSSEEYKLISQLRKKNYSWRINSQLNDFFSILLPRSLRYVDRSSMANGNEARGPLLDHNVIEYGMTSSLLNFGKDDKRSLLRSMGNPKALNLCGKNKKTIVDPQREWLYGDLFNWGIELILGNKSKLEEFYEVETLLENLQNQKEKWHREKKGNSGSFMQAINLAILIN